MITKDTALAGIPAGLRQELLEEYDLIIKHFMEHRWGPSEVNAGRFCEIVYCIVAGYPKNSYPAKAAKPTNFVDACRKLESVGGIPRSMQILIPRMLPPLYEIRNNRDAGHVGADVDPNHMDSAFAVSAANWIMGELVRVFHNVSIEEAQTIADQFAERRMTLVWQKGQLKRVLNPSFKLSDQLIILLGTSVGPVKISTAMAWLDQNHRGNFLKMANRMHKLRLVELDKLAETLEILPPGSKRVGQLLQELVGTK